MSELGQVQHYALRYQKSENALSILQQEQCLKIDTDTGPLTVSYFNYSVMLRHMTLNQPTRCTQPTC
ncbi:hypothetical protein PHAVU_011G159300 [Phaseolus vulgaris]|uniref:Uncharacterized protein n=1 Tax=Phaseolus vulgaris TaxID=3885 RepID=V7AM29_PHAVU|nr:hypothetical protein PHAVU_011G159300g [Phaseolus vulgaris]ESW05186.1 hypothetical protein PHAVU_011G159300g [Phaseolus vulgaris]